MTKSELKALCSTERGVFVSDAGKHWAELAEVIECELPDLRWSSGRRPSEFKPKEHWGVSVEVGMVNGENLTNRPTITASEFLRAMKEPQFIGEPFLHGSGKWFREVAPGPMEYEGTYTVWDMESYKIANNIRFNGNVSYDDKAGYWVERRDASWLHFAIEVPAPPPASLSSCTSVPESVPTVPTVSEEDKAKLLEQIALLKTLANIGGVAKNRRSKK